MTRFAVLTRFKITFSPLLTSISSIYGDISETKFARLSASTNVVVAIHALRADTASTTLDEAYNYSARNSSALGSAPASKPDQQGAFERARDNRARRPLDPARHDRAGRAQRFIHRAT